MDGRETMPDALESALKRIAAAVDSLERAAERRMRHDEARANAEEEYALMQDDRSRLAVELDAALDRSRALEAAIAEADARLARAAQAIGAIIERMDPPAD
jgi:predicted  nucleic acid-binding Zn-ribbon protein